MPRPSQRDYQNGKIYKLQCATTGQCYIGSTILDDLNHKLALHKTRYNRYLAGQSTSITSCQLFAAGAVSISIVISYPCNSKAELEAIERFYIENTPLCVNKQHPGRTPTEYYTENKARILSYRAELLNCPHCARQYARAYLPRHKKHCGLGRI